MAKRFLLIGIGGSGGKTLRYAEREVSRRLKEIEWNDEMPRAWRFLHIDVPFQPDVAEGDVPVDLGRTSTYLGLASSDHDYRAYDSDLVKNVDRLSEVAGWRPDPSDNFSPPYMGAGQRRVVGRVIALSQIKRIEGAIKEQLNQTETREALSELDQLDVLARNKLGGELGTPKTYDLSIIVAASLGGGSGSGIFLDVLEILSAEGHDPETMPILYAADVFSHLSDAASLGIEGNSLAAVSELISAFEHQGPIAEDESGFLGDVTKPRDKAGGKRVSCVSFFVGRGNGVIQFPHSADVFRSTGKALSAFMLNPAVAEMYGKYVGNNLSAKDLQPEFGLADATSDQQAASSLGYANVTLGRSLFAEYMAERLAKGALETLLDGHRKGLSADDLTSDDKLIDQIVMGGGDPDQTGIRVGFFTKVGLHEEGLGEKNDQILDALRNKDEKKARLRGVQESLMDKVRASKAERKAGGWLESFRIDFGAAADEFMREEEQILIDRARAWTREIQLSLVEQTASYVGEYGIPVTIRLLDELRDQLDRAASELASAAYEQDQKQGRVWKSIASAFEKLGPEKLITASHEAFGEAADVSRKGLAFRSEARVHELAVELMREIQSDVIPQLRSALLNLQQRLKIERDSQHTALVQQWSDGPVPPHLKSAPNEFLLEPEDEFPRRGGDLLAELLESEAADNAVRQAIEEIISGAWTTSGGDESGQTLFERLSSWVSSNPDLQEEKGASARPAQASFRIDLDVPNLLTRSREWVRSRERLGEYMNGSLAHWLDPKEIEAGSRGQTFVSGIRQALMSAAPLIDISPSVYKIVCGDDPPAPAFVVGGIPMASDHPSYEAVKEALVEVGFTPEEAGKLFDPNSTSGTVEISTFLPQTVHPVVFESIFEPIYKEWKSKTNQGQTQFWNYRRSRRLTSFIPLSPGRQIAMVRGFIVANLLGQLDTANHPCTIWTPRGPAAFPDDLLGRGVIGQGGLLPALLETLPLALTAFANGEGEALTPYLRLLELGASGSDELNGSSTIRLHPLSDKASFHEAKSSYRLGNELRDWIVAGRVREAEKGFPQAPTPPLTISGEVGGSLQSRCDAVLDSLQNELVDLRAFAGQFDNLTVDDTLRVPPRWELVSRIDIATDQLRIAVDLELEKDGDGVGGGGLT